MKLHLIAALFLTLPLPALAADNLPQAVAQVLAEAGPGTRWGAVVADMDGNEVIAIDPDGRYVPASNTKLFTTAAAFWKLGLPALEEPDQAGRTSAYLIPSKANAPDVVLYGRGDARLSSANDCKIDCLSALADSIAKRTRRVGNVTGDDTMFLDQRWSPGMSWNNIPTDSGTGVSALSLDDNEAVVTVRPGKDGGLPLVTGPGYFTYENRAATYSKMVMTDAVGPPPIRSALPVSADEPKPIAFTRMPGSRLVQITGAIKLGAAPIKLVLGIDDPSDYTVWTFAQMLRAQGVEITGEISREPIPAAEVAISSAEGFNADTDQAAPPLIEDLTIINKVSQNLHAELLLRRLGATDGDGSIEGGQKVVTAMLTEAGLKPHQYNFADGSGMSTYNRVSPGGVVAFLRWTHSQPWGAKFKATLPIGGVDGTLKNRFKGTSLEGKIMAKTGTLNATNAIAGFLTAKSGKVLVFSAYANDVPDDVRATALAERALVLIAEAN